MIGRRYNVAILTLGLALGGCQSTGTKPAPQADASNAGTWRATATDADRMRIRNWYASWDAAISDARARGHSEDLNKEGALLQPMAALPNAHLPAGDYRCRTIKLGSRAGTGPALVAYGWFQCRVSAEQGLASLTKLTGSQRTIGLVFPDNLKRQIFLGTMQLGDEKRPIRYGSDRMRDMAGLVERIDDQRWRLVLPSPAYESLLDVMELVPAG